MNRHQCHFSVVYVCDFHLWSFVQLMSSIIQTHGWWTWFYSIDNSFQFFTRNDFCLFNCMFIAHQVFQPSFEHEVLTESKQEGIKSRIISFLSTWPLLDCLSLVMLFPRLPNTSSVICMIKALRLKNCIWSSTIISLYTYLYQHNGISIWILS